ncbi:hypothetical protein [Kutzneria kofuensis]|uniref:hypothetical protein n=1 Tax=Kutzneria kofuensis TaxID=103725 RepID=UPI0031EE4B97
MHLNLLAPSDRHRADRGDDDEQEPKPEREPDDAGPTSSVTGRGVFAGPPTADLERGPGAVRPFGQFGARAAAIRARFRAGGPRSRIVIRCPLSTRPAAPLVDARTADLDEFAELVLTNTVGKGVRECGPLVAAHHMAAVRTIDHVAVLDDRNKFTDSRLRGSGVYEFVPAALTMVRLHSPAELGETEPGSGG